MPPPQVLARTELPALRYRFNSPIARDALPPYSWHYAPWTKCSAQCAGGEAGVGPGYGHCLVTRTDLLDQAELSSLSLTPRQPGAGCGVSQSTGQLSRGPPPLQRPQQAPQEAAGLQHRALPSRVSAHQGAGWE